MKIAILVYDQMTALDAIGPYEVLSRLPGAQVSFVAEQAGSVTMDTGFLTVAAPLGIASVQSADILLVPGGNDAVVRKNSLLLSWIRSIHDTTKWTTSVCTGSLILGAARLLHDKQATTHWMQMEKLAEFGAKPVKQRFVEDGKIVTAAGVSAGIDMALWLVGKLMGPELAQAVQLGIEYDPQPPFNAGSPDKAPAPIVEMVRTVMSQRDSR